MIDKNFDPYEKLLLCEKNITELVFAINEMSEHLKNCSKQIETQAKLLRYLNDQNENTQIELKLLKQRLNLAESNKTV